MYIVAFSKLPLPLPLCYEIRSAQYRDVEFLIFRAQESLMSLDMPRAKFELVRVVREMLWHFDKDGAHPIIRVSPSTQPSTNGTPSACLFMSVRNRLLPSAGPHLCAYRTASLSANRAAEPLEPLIKRCVESLMKIIRANVSFLYAPAVGAAETPLRNMIAALFSITQQKSMMRTLVFYYLLPRLLQFLK